jgi:hypothetical protein
MKYPLIFTRAFLATITIFLTVQVAGSTDCTPTGTHLNDTTTGQCAINEQVSIVLTKKGHWNISWPDGHFDSWTVTGTGRCTWNRECGFHFGTGVTNCWPLFHPPATTSAGVFSIRVDNQMTVPESRTCPDGITQARDVFCEITGITVFEKPHTCSSGGGGGESDECTQVGMPCSGGAACCDPNENWCNRNTDLCEDCPGQLVDGICTETPIVVDVLGNGFSFTNLASGVTFDLNADGTAEHLSWTSTGSDDAWIALDRNGNGTIDDGIELFGEFTPQPVPPVGQRKNGFIALREYDKPANGGNNDGVVSSADSVFSLLRLWQDLNHNGVSEVSELFSLKDVGLKTIELDYRLSKKADEHGNQFRYRAKVKDKKGAQLGRWAWDVLLIAEP